MRFLGLGLADPVPDANTIWTFREALTRATLRGRPAIEVLFGAYEAALNSAGFLAMGGQIVDASIIAAPKQRNTNAEKRDKSRGHPGRVGGARVTAAAASSSISNSAEGASGREKWVTDGAFLCSSFM